MKTSPISWSTFVLIIALLTTLVSATWAVGEYVLSTKDGKDGIGTTTPEHKLDVDGAIKSVKYPFLARHTAGNILIDSDGVLTISERIDPDNVYSNNTFTAPVDGYYRFDTSFTIFAGNNSTDAVIYGIYRNGSMDGYSNTVDLTLGKMIDRHPQSLSAMMHLEANDTVDVRFESVDPGLHFHVRNMSFMGHLISAE